MWSTLPILVIVIAQAQPTPPAKWCFERGQRGAQLCEETESECNKLRNLNTEIATSECKRVEEILVPPTEPAPPNPKKPDRDLPR
jgi:hypothetical protein